MAAGLLFREFVCDFNDRERMKNTSFDVRMFQQSLGSSDSGTCIFIDLLVLAISGASCNVPQLGFRVKSKDGREFTSQVFSLFTCFVMPATDAEVRLAISLGVELSACAGINLYGIFVSSLLVENVINEDLDFREVADARFVGLLPGRQALYSQLDTDSCF